MFRVISPPIPAVNRSSRPYPGDIHIFLSAFANKISTPLSFFAVPPIPQACPHFGVRIPISSPLRLSMVITTIWVVVESEYLISFSSNCVFSVALKTFA